MHERIFKSQIHSTYTRTIYLHVVIRSRSTHRIKIKKKNPKTEICDISVRHVYRNVL